MTKPTTALQGIK